MNVTMSGGKFTYGNDDTAAKAIKSTGNLIVNGGTMTIKTTGVETEGTSAATFTTSSMVTTAGNPGGR